MFVQQAIAACLVLPLMNSITGASGLGASVPE